MKYLFIFTLISLFVYTNSHDDHHHHHQQDSDKNIHVTIANGKIKGSLLTTRLGKTIYSFRGVRYAEPPVGPLRFKPPVAAKPWSGVFDASEDGPACPQPVNITKSEDCLRLNVYTTKLPSERSTVARPVLVFLHAGAFVFFSALSTFLGPEFLLDQDIVLVTANYRLGSLGFLSTGDSLAPGNNGYKDQVEVLRWVQKNIAAFGGDPNSVTLSGYSAGAWSTALHMVSPMSKGLFHRAIAMSGSDTMQYPFPSDQKNVAVKQAELLGCPTQSTQSILDCLISKPVKDFEDTAYPLLEWRTEPVLVFSPVVEPEVEGNERFLTGQPKDLIKQGKFHHVPFIAGVTKDEFAGYVIKPLEAARKGNDSAFQNLNEKWTQLAPIYFLYELNTSRSLEISEDFRQFYLKGQPISVNNYKGLAELYADGVVIFGVHRMVQLLGRYSTQPVYYYKFAYQGRYSWETFSDNKTIGVLHHDDMLYLFNISFYPRYEKNAPEIPTINRMTTLWGNFVKTGNPTPAINQLLNCRWNRFTPENQAYLEIGDKLSMQSGLYTQRMKEWEKFFPL